MKKVSEMVYPTPEIIVEAKRSYNRILKRYREAEKFLDDPQVPQTEKDKRIITFRIEIVDVLEAYLEVLKNWGVQISDDEIMGGMKIE